jgi:GMP synthase (glutamine-hydrolysing)
VGAAPVRWTQAAMEDPVIQGVRAKTVVAHWHGDTYAPVSGAVLLASTDRYSQQAFRLGTTYGFQFHLELGAAELQAYFDAEAEDLRSRGKDVVELKAQLPKLKANEPEISALLERLAHHFATVARQAR